MTMSYHESHENIDWIRVAHILEAAGMSHHAAETHKQAFEAS